MAYQLTSGERKHVKDAGARFNRALARATLVVRTDERLIGLDRIRVPLAFKAALKATGYETARFIVPLAAGRPTVEINEVVAEVFDRAVSAARDAQGEAL